MNFKNNLDFAEVFVRYMILMAIGITAGVTVEYWMVIPANMVLLSAILGWCPIKQMITNRRKRIAQQVHPGHAGRLAA